MCCCFWDSVVHTAVHLEIEFKRILAISRVHVVSPHYRSSSSTVVDLYTAPARRDHAVDLWQENDPFSSIE